MSDFMVVKGPFMFTMLLLWFIPIMVISALALRKAKIEFGIVWSIFTVFYAVTLATLILGILGRVVIVVLPSFPTWMY